MNMFLSRVLNFFFQLLYYYLKTLFLCFSSLPFSFSQLFGVRWGYPCPILTISHTIYAHTSSPHISFDHIQLTTNSCSLNFAAKTFSVFFFFFFFFHNRSYCFWFYSLIITWTNNLSLQIRKLSNIKIF